jgi:succinate dehydrogenase hydrophobic anchor subunit
MLNQTKVDELTSSLKQYVATSAELFKLEAIEQGANISSKLMSTIIIGLIMLLFLVFGSIGVSFILADYFESYYIGFLIVAAGYFVIGLFLLLFRKRMIEFPFKNHFIKTIFYK